MSCKVFIIFNYFLLLLIRLTMSGIHISELQTILKCVSVGEKEFTSKSS